MAPYWYIVAILIGMLASAFFSGIETGLISLNRVRLRNEVEHKNRRAMILNTFVESTERLLGTALIGSNLANVLVAVSASTLVTHWLSPSPLVGLATTIVAALLLVIVSEIAPKSLFRRYSYRLCMTFADVLNAIAWLFAPLVGLLGILMRAIARVGRGTDQPRSFFVTREELKHLAQEGEAGGALTTDERQMIDKVFDFPHKTVHEIMVPLSRTVTVAANTPVEELFEISQRTGYARLPVREGEKMLGVVNVYEILFENAPRDGKTARDLMQNLQFVRATDRIDRVLPVLRASRNPISVVINPEGRHLGIVTIEDIVEEIVGDVEG
jgi:CBS domain containing-hemolysin-like protein